MIYFHIDKLDDNVSERVIMSFIRSYTETQICRYTDNADNGGIHVLVNPIESDLELVNKLASESAKLVILGGIPSNIAELIGLEVERLPADAYLWDQCDAAPVHNFAESAARIHYKNLPDSLECPIAERALLRYDFAREWNNLGYGHVRTDGTMWSIACKAEAITAEVSPLAAVYRGNEFLTLYVSLVTVGNAEVLWVNRAAGLIDSHEFRLIETFISNYKSADLPCLPFIREIPYGYDAMVSMRLDCDEDIASAAPLFELYKSCNVPFSLALRTGQAINKSDIDLISDVLQNNGSILSHSVNHKANWGDDYSDVLLEAENSRDEIKNTFGVACVDYAVSPFHQNPDYAIQALNDANYKGFIGGIICNDPQYLVARGGKISSYLDIVTHSQQCMLHGDCMLEYQEDSLEIFKRCAEYSIKSGAAFAYLDHPFSARYQYGWLSEKQRIDTHGDWLDFLNGLGNVLYTNEGNLLQHIREKSNTEIWLVDREVRSSLGNQQTLFPLAYEFEGDVRVLS